MTTQSMSEGSVLSALSNDLARAVEQAAAGTVTINARRRQPASGIIWSADGVILTADHVIEREEEIKIGLPDGKEIPATLVGRDPGTDLALLRAAGSGMKAVERGPMPGIGNLVLAVARPDTDGPMATLGVVSAVGGPVRTWRGGQLERFIRSDVILYPGFSGGPLVDANGRAVGINTSHLSRGSGIAIPMETAQRVAEALLSHGKIRRGYLGISSQPVNLPANATSQAGGQASGLLILRVEPDGPAEKAGLILGDILVSLAGEPVKDVDDLQRLLSGERVGQATPVKVLRGGEPREISVTIGERS
ncbi:MAG: S1C family serine protease [Dehalococcoidia bacterium]